MSTTIEYLRDLIAGLDRGDWTAEQVVERVREAVAPERLDGSIGRPFRDLQTTGLLWYLNRTALWPRGLALALLVEAGVDGGMALGWEITGDGVEPITAQSDEAKQLAAVERLFALATALHEVDGL